MTLKTTIYLLVFYCYNIYAQINLNNCTFSLDKYNDQINFEEAILLDKKGNFNIPVNIKTYQFLKNKEAGWLVINIPKQEKRQFISIENSLFEALNFYIYNKNLKKELTVKKNYRFPTVEIAQNITPCKLYIRTKDALSYRTEFMIKAYNTEQFETETQRDYFFIGAYVLSLLVLLISASIIFLYKRKYAILWYIIHLSMLIVEYLISTGVFSQWFIDPQFILTYGLDHITMLISTMALSEFFRNFYIYNKKTNFCKYIYLAISVCCALGAIYAIVDGFLGNIYNVEAYAQTVLNYASLASLIVHFILVFYRVIPIYLFIAFLLPVLGIFANLGDFKNLFENPNVVYFIFQSVYLGILIEVIIIIFYIVKQAVDGELLSIKLSQENNQLKNSFQEKILTLQEEHQNTLVNDVHDSFGGYIQALKINLLQKDLNGDKVNSILNSFQKDYRFLLNSLYIPNINANNFENAISEYVNKMNPLTKAVILLNCEKEQNLNIPKNIAKLIYMSASELTTNAIKYANADNIKLDIQLSRNDISLIVQDDGKGFKPNDIKNTSFGLRSVMDRVKSLHGLFELSSNQETGTQISIKIFFNA